MQKKNLDVLGYERRKNGDVIWINLSTWDYYPLMFCSERYLTHLEIICKGENLAIGNLKGGFKLRDIHEETKATNRYFKSRAIIF